VGKQADVRVRRGEAPDIDFVIALADESVDYGVPAGRTPDRVVLATRTRDGLAALADRLDDDRFVVLIGEVGSEPVGYLILDLVDREPTTGEPQALIVDIAVRRAHWGRYVTHRLVREAARLAEGRGLGYLVGMISASNQRALRTAERLGFSVERHQVVMRLPGKSTRRE
jgi:GNAT superfamily N-acetyltransferase